MNSVIEKKPALSKISKSVALAKHVLDIEAHAISALKRNVGRSFEEAVTLLLQCQGRVVVTGMGKPGFIGRKISATFSSTGTPSVFMHPAEAVHGDLGLLKREDVMLAISNSGETEEITKLLSTIKKIGSKVIAMTGNADSTLAGHANVLLHIEIKKEACPLNLAPTASTTAALALGDALAIAVLDRRGFKPEDFAFLHPGGSLGKKLLRVGDVMRKGRDQAVVPENTRVQGALIAITKARAGCCVITNASGRLLGIFTDGDLRRRLESGEKNLLNLPVLEIATKKPLSIEENKLAAEALQILRDKKIDELPVVNNAGKVVGLLDVQDLLKVGFV
ncbi:MAG: KpsF/GutQ family sugar-phosphate isomerase [Candidatus Omnitrophica bacterium]|nr:KpsF/GutQ family sugar-phosphate isomerase [Candidatus Omnitrophota bacterium]